MIARGGVWPRGELRRIVKRWKKIEYVSRWICVVRISDARGNVSGRGGVWPRGELRWIRESGAQGRK